MTRISALKEIQEMKDMRNVMLAFNVISKVGTIADVSTLIPITTNAATNPSVKKMAIGAICSIIKENLLARFNEIPHDTRQKLVLILQTYDPNILNSLYKDLMSDDDNCKMPALQLLGILKHHPKMKDLLIKLLSDKSPKIKATAMSLLSNMVDQNDQQSVVTLLSDADKRVRANTVEVLEAIGNPRLAPVLFKYRKDSNNRVRGNVLKALYNLGTTNIEEDLLEMLNTKDAPLIATALWVIQQTRFRRNPKVLDATGACLTFNDEMVHKRAVAALEAMKTPKSLGYLKHLGNIYTELSTIGKLQPEK
ncbi:MAG: HEAT repeat domain-containing protein [Chitinispirillales bacterium]|jgi:HEAT repeat protein|nr:HEAT repeat domain-containing protein [Chitinispirillales bacterium]